MCVAGPVLIHLNYKNFKSITVPSLLLVGSFVPSHSSLPTVVHSGKIYSSSSAQELKRANKNSTARVVAHVKQNVTYVKRLLIPCLFANSPSHTNTNTQNGHFAFLTFWSFEDQDDPSSDNAVMEFVSHDIKTPDSLPLLLTWRIFAAACENAQTQKK